MSDNHKQEARALELMRQYRNAVDPDTDSDADPDELLTKIETILDFVDTETRDRLEEAFGQLEDKLADRAFQNYAAIADKIRSVKEGFELSQRLVEEDEKDLFFPAAAMHLAQVSGLLKELKQAADAVKDDLDNLGAAFKKRDVEALVQEGTSVFGTIEELLETLEGIKDDLPES